MIEVLQMNDRRLQKNERFHFSFSIHNSITIFDQFSYFLNGKYSNLGKLSQANIAIFHHIFVLLFDD